MGERRPGTIHQVECGRHHMGAIEVVQGPGSLGPLPGITRHQVTGPITETLVISQSMSQSHGQSEHEFFLFWFESSTVTTTTPLTMTQCTTHTNNTLIVASPNVKPHRVPERTLQGGEMDKTWTGTLAAGRQPDDHHHRDTNTNG